MRRFGTFYYCLSNGKAPVGEFIDSLSAKSYSNFVFKKELLEEFGPKLSMPHAKHMGKGLYELRVSDLNGKIRLFYFFVKRNSIIFVHVIVKKTQKTPKKDLNLAYKRMTDYKNN